MRWHTQGTPFTRACGRRRAAMRRRSRKWRPMPPSTPWISVRSMFRRRNPATRRSRRSFRRPGVWTWSCTTPVTWPSGKRPFRVHIDPTQDSAEVVNAVSDRVRAELLRRIGLGDLLVPRAYRASLARELTPSLSRALEFRWTTRLIAQHAFGSGRRRLHAVVRSRRRCGRRWRACHDPSTTLTIGAVHRDRSVHTRPASASVVETARSRREHGLRSR